MLIKQITLCTILAVLAASATVANAGVTGFVDAQITSGAGDTNNSPTARVADGAIFFNDKVGTSSVMVDIPFKFSGTGMTNAFDLAKTKGQAYVSHGYDFGLTWSLGQWENIFGYEKNHSIDNRFTSTGIVHGQMPETHTGLLLDYVNGAFEVKALAANHLNQGLRNGDNFDYGAQLKWKHDAMYLAAGYLHHKLNTTGVASMLADFMLGWAGNNITADADVVLSKAAVTGATTGVGFGAWLGYTMNAWNIATRFEYGSKLANYTEMMWTVGPSYKFNEKLTCKLDYSLDSAKALSTTATAVTTHTGTLSAQYKF